MSSPERQVNSSSREQYPEHSVPIVGDQRPQLVSNTAAVAESTPMQLPQPERKYFANLRPPVNPPAAGALISALSLGSSHRIRFCHPHYPDSSNILLDLFAPDHPSGGLQYSLANVACGIVAGNRWDGYFSQTPDGPRLDYEPHRVLLCGDYFYHLAGSSTEDPYPIVPTFREWAFPHRNFPEPWDRLIDRPDSPSLNRTHAISSLYPALLSRDTSCRISGCEEATQAAHIIPQAETDWFERNGMSRYNVNTVSIGSRSCDDTGNAMLLRADLHTLFDAAKFVFVPKTPAPDPEEGEEASLLQPELVTHLIVNSIELHTLYHNTRLQPLGGVSTQFLLARFAWALFPNLVHFLRGGVPRSLKLNPITMVVGTSGEWVDAQGCQRLLARPNKSRSESPRKRSRRDGEADESEDLSNYDLYLSQWKRQRRDSYGRGGSADSLSIISTIETDDLPDTPEPDLLSGQAGKTRTSGLPPVLL